MKTKDELKARARGIAEGFFYCDDECEIAWQPFEDYPDRFISEQVDDLTETIYNAMLWAQEGLSSCD